MIPSDLITAIEAGEILRVSAASVRRWVRTGKLPGFRIVGSLRVSKAGVLALAERYPEGIQLETRSEYAARMADVDATLKAAGIRK